MYETECLLFSAGHKNKETIHNRAAQEHVTPTAGYTLRHTDTQIQTHRAQTYWSEQISGSMNISNSQSLKHISKD